MTVHLESILVKFDDQGQSLVTGGKCC